MEETTKENTEEQAALFAALADPTRLKLLKLLCQQRDPDALCVNALAYHLNVTQSAVSQHLRILKSLGLVKGERRGYHIHYFMNREALERYRAMLSAVLNIRGTEEELCQNRCPERRKQNVSRE